MTGRMMMYIAVTLMGLVLFLLSGWVFLLDGETMSLMRTGLGLLFIVAGGLNIRREWMAQQDQ